MIRQLFFIVGATASSMSIILFAPTLMATVIQWSGQ